MLIDTSSYLDILIAVGLITYLIKNQPPVMFYPQWETNFIG